MDRPRASALAFLFSCCMLLTFILLQRNLSLRDVDRIPVTSTKTAEATTTTSTETRTTSGAPTRETPTSTEKLESTTTTTTTRTTRTSTGERELEERRAAEEAFASASLETAMAAMETMEAMADPFSRLANNLAKAGVIGEVVDSFVPTVDLSVKYGEQTVTAGIELLPSETAIAARVEIGGNVDRDLFTLVMTDPDAPSPQNPTKREWLHWIVSNIPGGTDDLQGTTVVQYAGPTPPVGMHRYIFLLFRQRGGPIDIAPPAQRANFNTRNFASQYGLSLPVAGIHFIAQKERK